MSFWSPVQSAPPFTRPIPHTSPALPVSPRSHMSVGLIKRVHVHAMGLPGILRRDAITSQNIFSACCRVKVIRVDTSSVPAQVIECLIPERADQADIGDPVSQPTPARRGGA